MKSSAKKVELASVDDLFTTEQERQQAGEERVVRIPLSQLHYFKGYPAMQTEVPFAGQPYRVKDDDPKMLETLDSIRQRGVRTPGLVRPDPDGGYEIISGHRRHRASELAGLEDMPVIIREMNDEEAVIEMVDANIQREDVLPSEKAWAYRMKLEAIKRQGERTDLTSAQVGPKLTAAEKIAENSPDSKSQIKRYIRLTELIPELLDMVDEKKIALNPAYELSFLKKEEQRDLLDAMDSEQATPSLSQAQRLKKYSQEGHLTLDIMRVIMGEEKKSDLDKVTLSADILRKYFPKSYTPQRMQETIIKLLEGWQKKRQRDQERGKEPPMRDISARELKGHNILAVERFQDNTRWMIEFSVLRPCSYGSPGDEMRLFLTEDGYQAALVSQKRREIKIKRYARVIEGHVLDFKPDKRRHS